MDLKEIVEGAVIELQPTADDRLACDRSTQNEVPTGPSVTMPNSKGSSKPAQKGQKGKNKSSTASTKTATSRKTVVNSGNGGRSNTVSATNHPTGVTVTDSTLTLGLT